MMQSRWMEFFVGLFVIIGICGLFYLGFSVSGLVSVNDAKHQYTLKASFDNIGGLKVRAPVRMAGVTIGRVTAIHLNPLSYRAQVQLAIDYKVKTLPVDTSASIYTEGLLGANYINLTAGFDDQYLKNGDILQTTHSAVILENLIGQLLFNLSRHKSGSKKTN